MSDATRAEQIALINDPTVFTREVLEDVLQATKQKGYLKKDKTIIQYLSGNGNEMNEMLPHGFMELASVFFWMKIQPPKIVDLVLQQDPQLLDRVKEQTNEMCLGVVKEYPICLKYVQKQNVKIILTALSAANQGCGHSLLDVKWEQLSDADALLIVQKLRKRRGTTLPTPDTQRPSEGRRNEEEVAD